MYVMKLFVVGYGVYVEMVIKYNVMVMRGLFVNLSVSGADRVSGIAFRVMM